MIWPSLALRLTVITYAEMRHEAVAPAHFLAKRSQQKRMCAHMPAPHLRYISSNCDGEGNLSPTATQTLTVLTKAVFRIATRQQVAC